MAPSRSPGSGSAGAESLTPIPAWTARFQTALRSSEAGSRGDSLLFFSAALQRDANGASDDSASQRSGGLPPSPALQTASRRHEARWVVEKSGRGRRHGAARGPASVLHVCR
ncbi:hypothetical protein GN956_G25333 [Arapaima gigas]